MTTHPPKLNRLDIPRPPSLELYTIGETAAILGVSRRSVANWIKQGALTAIRLGPGQRMLRVRVADLEAFIAAYNVQAPGMRPAGQPYDPVKQAADKAAAPDGREEHHDSNHR